ncbi:hypothetical protein MMC30_006257 [Trapelia coarctata]|nr:hypothetical protein [Trapelia coarctata]
MPPPQASRGLKRRTKVTHSIAGQKRKKSPSSPGTDRTRTLLPIDPPPDLILPGPLGPEGDRHCANCGLPCWRCHNVFVVRHESSGYPEDGSEPKRAFSENSSVVPAAASMPLTEKQKTYAARGITYLGPRDKYFNKCILKPCGMTFDTHAPMDVTPATVFGSQQRPPSSRVFLRIDLANLREIIQDFYEYQDREYNEHTLSTLCQDSIVRRDRFINMPSPGENCEITSVRRDKWKPQKEGPSVPGGVCTYDWDIEPDITYAVSTNIFDSGDREVLNLKPWQRWLSEENAACPYLTIEFKCGSKTGKRSHAISQNAAASLLWLYQRRQIRETLNLPLDELRHYSIIILDATYAISEGYFKDKSYRIRTLAVGALGQLDSLLKYIEWSNAIHAWGLGPNATSFKGDIEKLIKLKWGTEAFPALPSTA